VNPGYSEESSKHRILLAEIQKSRKWCKSRKSRVFLDAQVIQRMQVSRNALSIKESQYFSRWVQFIKDFLSAHRNLKMPRESKQFRKYRNRGYHWYTGKSENPKSQHIFPGCRGKSRISRIFRICRISDCSRESRKQCYILKSFRYTEFISSWSFHRSSSCSPREGMLRIRNSVVSEER